MTVSASVAANCDPRLISLKQDLEFALRSRGYAKPPAQTEPHYDSYEARSARFWERQRQMRRRNAILRPFRYLTPPVLFGYSYIIVSLSFLFMAFGGGR